MKILSLFAVIFCFVSCQKKSDIVSLPPIRNLTFTWWAATSDSTNTYTPTAGSYININGTQYNYPFAGIYLNRHKWVYSSVLHQGDIFSSQFEGTFTHLGAVVSDNFALQVHCDCDLSSLLFNSKTLVSQLPNGDIVFGTNPNNRTYEYIIVVP